MSYYVKTVGKKPDVVYQIENDPSLDSGVKAFIVSRIKAISDPVPGSTTWPQFNSVFVEAQGHLGSNDLVRVEGVQGAPPAPAPEPSPNPETTTTA